MSDPPGSATKRGGGGTVSDGSSGTSGSDKSVKRSSNDDDDGKEDKNEGGGIKAGSDAFSHDGLKALLRSISQAYMSAGNCADDSAKSGSADPEKDKTVVSTSTTSVKKINKTTAATPHVAAVKPSPLDSFLRIGKESVVVGDANDTPREKQGGAAGGSDTERARPAEAVMREGDDALGVGLIAEGGGCNKKKPVNLDVCSNAEGFSDGGTPSLQKVAKGRDEGTKKPASSSVCPTRKGEVIAGQGGGGTPRTDRITGGPGEGGIEKKHVSLTERSSQEKAPGAEHEKDTEKPMSVTLYSNVEKVGGGWWGGGTKKPVSMVAYTAAGRVAAPTAGVGQKGGGAMNGLVKASKVTAVFGGTTENRGSSGSSGGVSSSPGSVKEVTTGLGRGGEVGAGGKRPGALPSGLKKVSGQQHRQQTGERCDGAAGTNAKKSAMSILVPLVLRKQRPRSPAMPVADIFTRGDDPPPGPEKEPSTPGQVRMGFLPFRFERHSKCSQASS